MTEPQAVPVRVRVHLAHATVQAIADEAAADVLHIKGPAADPLLRPGTSTSADADVLVRPSHLKRFLRGLGRHGWIQMTKLRSGGLVEHSTNWFHPSLGQMDVHIRFPGIQIGAAEAFDALWEGHGTRPVAHRPCVVPGLLQQRLILLLHAARSPARNRADVDACWTNASPEDRAEVERLAAALHADVALAAATGRLEEYRDSPEYDLWRLFVDETVTQAGFRRIAAEVRAAPEGMRFARLRVANYLLHAFLFMSRRVSNQTGARPTLRQTLAAYITFLNRGRDAFGRPPVS